MLDRQMAGSRLLPSHELYQEKDIPVVQYEDLQTQGWKRRRSVHSGHSVCLEYLEEYFDFLLRVLLHQPC